LNSLRSVTTKNCKHLVIDAGHISIESNLANKEAVREIHMKRNQQYNDDDYKRLESLMYDRLSLKLEAAQVWTGFEAHLRGILQFSAVRDRK
jgi:vacuolar protein sorting-associated protein 13A/C